jgi:hypothetical protein
MVLVNPFIVPPLYKAWSFLWRDKEVHALGFVDAAQHVLRVEFITATRCEYWEQRLRSMNGIRVHSMPNDRLLMIDDL